jgi:hypothetical protein
MRTYGNITGFYTLDGVSHEFGSDGKTCRDPQTLQPITRVWAYPVLQGVWGGSPEKLYFSTPELRREYMREHDYCDALPRCKVPHP